MKTTNMLSVVSVIIFIIFIILAIGSMSESWETYHIGDGIYDEIYTVNLKFPYGFTFAYIEEEHKYYTIGPKDSGRWHGEVIKSLSKSEEESRGRLLSIENYKHGKRHGKQVYYKEDGSIQEVVYYDEGERIPNPNQSNQSDYVLNGVTTSQKGYFFNIEEISNYADHQIEFPSFTSKAHHNQMLKYFQQNAGARRSVYYNFIKQINPSKSQSKVERKSADLSFSYRITETSVYGYLRYESPWYVFFIEMFFDSTHVMAFIADIEDYISAASPEDDTEFMDAYLDALEEIGENHIMIDMHQFLVEIEASQNIKSFPLRLALFDRCYNPEKSTYQILEENYSDFLEKLYETADYNEIKAFTDTLDIVYDGVEEFQDFEDHLLWIHIDTYWLLIIASMYEQEIHPKLVEAVLIILVFEYASEADPVHEALKAVYFRDPVSVDTVDEIGVPDKILLEQNYPNPFNPSTTISYSIHKQLHTRIQIYDIAGKEVATLVDEMKNPGYYEIKFDASDLPSGVYIYRLQAGEHVDSKKLLYLK